MPHPPGIPGGDLTTFLVPIFGAIDTCPVIRSNRSNKIALAVILLAAGVYQLTSHLEAVCQIPYWGWGFDS